MTNEQYLALLRLTLDTLREANRANEQAISLGNTAIKMVETHIDNLEKPLIDEVMDGFGAYKPNE